MCWLHANKVACWGSGAAGQLGLRDQQSRSAPTLVPGIDDAVDVAAGGSTTCVLRSSGRVACWGANGAGASCGTSACGEPAEIGGVRDAVRIAVGGSHACAVLASGALTCWGQNDGGQLSWGAGAGPSPPEGRPPSLVAGVTDAFSVSAGTRSTCVLRKDGEVACFGLDDRGRLGDSHSGSECVDDLGCADGGATVDAKSRGPAAVPGLHDVIALASSGPHSCAVRRDGSVICWGAAAEATRAVEEKVAPALLEGIFDVHRVAVSETGPCVLHKNGEVSCDNHVPRKIPGLTSATAIAVGNAFACATRASGRPVCWGTNGDGVLGIGQQAFFPTPIAVEGIDDAVEVETTEYATCVRRSSGHVACWGGFSVSPDRWKPVEVPGLADATHLWGGFGRTCASRSSGAVTCFNAGHDVATDPKMFDVPGKATRVAPRGTPGVALNNGSLFYFDETGRDKRTSPIVGVTDVVAVQASYADACAVQKSGAIVCWSAPADPGSTLGKPSHPTLRRVKAPPAVDVAGYSGWCAALRSGEMVSFGLASEDELAATTERGVSDAVGVRQSGTGKCALLASGGVWCTALLYGGGTSEEWMERGPVAGVADAVSVGIASHHACVVNRGGRVLCWGSNSGGLLGRHERGSSDVPVEVLDPVQAAGGASADAGVVGGF